MNNIKIKHGGKKNPITHWNALLWFSLVLDSVDLARSTKLTSFLYSIQVAKQLKEQQMVMRGHRETSMVHELNRWAMHFTSCLCKVWEYTHCILCLDWHFLDPSAWLFFKLQCSVHGHGVLSLINSWTCTAGCCCFAVRKHAWTPELPFSCFIFHFVYAYRVVSNGGGSILYFKLMNSIFKWFICMS